MQNPTYTYQVSYYGHEELSKPAEQRGYPKHQRVRATSAKRALNSVQRDLVNATPAGEPGSSALHWLILEVKVVA